MKESAPSTESTEAPSAIERPSWRFSGRRGTPVHLRDQQASTTLPPEIQRAVVQLAREQAAERTTQATQRSPQRMQWTPRQETPVSAAPVPVERRTRREAPKPTVAPPTIDGVPASAKPAPISLDMLAPTPEPTPVITGPARAREEQQPDLPTALELPNTPELSTAPELPTTLDAPSPDPTLEVATPVAPPIEQAPAAPQAAEPIATATPSPASQPKSRAEAKRELKERARRAKARARRAKEREQAAKRAAKPATPSSPLRALFGRGAGATTSQEAASTALAPSDASSIVDVDLGPATPSPASSHVPHPDPSGGLDAAGQSAWEIGRLPFLLVAPTHREATGDVVVAALTTPPVDSSTAGLRPMAWEPFDDGVEATLPAPAAATPAPAPAPVETTEPVSADVIAPAPEAPAAIARLDAPLFAARANRPRASSTPRERIAARRAALDAVARELATLAEPSASDD